MFDDVPFMDMRLTWAIPLLPRMMHHLLGLPQTLQFGSTRCVAAAKAGPFGGC